MTLKENEMLNELSEAQNFVYELSENLNTQGVAASGTEGLDTLVPKVLEIDSGGDSINAFLEVDYFSQSAPIVVDPSGGETWVSHDGKLYQYDIATSQWIFWMFADENTVYIADAAMPIGIKRRYSVIFRNGTYILLSMVNLPNKPHDDTLNKNGNPLFLHATQAQHDRWDDTYTKSEVEQIKLELLNLIYAGL